VVAEQVVRRAQALEPSQHEARAGGIGGDELELAKVSGQRQGLAGAAPDGSGPIGGAKLHDAPAVVELGSPGGDVEPHRGAVGTGDRHRGGQGGREVDDDEVARGEEVRQLRERGMGDAAGGRVGDHEPDRITG
jgi:hypothetical protein